MKRTTLILLTLLLTPALAGAQISGGIMAVRDSATGTVVANIGDTTNSALRVYCVASTCASAAATFGSGVPSTGSAAGFSDGSNTRMASVVDVDTGAGAQYAQVVTLRRSASGGAVEMLGVSTAANSFPVTIASDQASFTVAATQSATWTVQPGNTANTTAWLFRQDRSTSATAANVSASATNVTCLASNAARRGMTLYNDSTVRVYVKFGATASATSFTVPVEGGGFYQMADAGYSGVVDCIWTSATGSARVTEW